MKFLKALLLIVLILIAALFMAMGPFYCLGDENSANGDFGTHVLRRLNLYDTALKVFHTDANVRCLVPSICTGISVSLLILVLYLAVRFIKHS